MNTAAAHGAVQMLAAAVNTGARQAGIAEALGSEHGYLVNQIVYGIALGVIRKCRFALRSDESEPVASCGSIMYPLATDPGGREPRPGGASPREDKVARDDHPYHDGELTCNAIRGALVTLNCYKDESWRRSTCYIWRIEA
ncbi:MAG TPA: hypothetical protein VFB99_01625 [Vicinamibacterales bacterium]|nr:hypothetical protein [Vicinamibacterales bacterium]